MHSTATDLKDLQSKKPQLLFLPKWYPNHISPFDGNFIENHAHAIALLADVSVLFVHSDESLNEQYQLKVRQNKSLNEVRCYFKKPKTPFGLLNKIISAYRYFTAQKKAFEFIRKEQKIHFDFIHIHVLSRTALFALSLKRKLNLPVGITEHWSGYLPESKQYKGFLKKWLTQKAVRSATFVSCVSPYLRDAMMNHGLKNDYRIIPNVVDCEIFKPIDKLIASKIQVLFVGNLLQSPKRILDIIEVFRNIQQKRKDFVLNIYGEGEDESKCIEIIEKNGLKDFIKLNGTRSREEIAKIMAKSDFLFLYSEFENQPCVINEAQACGLPVVVPDIPGIMAYMQDELGIVFPKLKPEAFEEAILQMMDNYNRYNTNNIRNFALRNFSEKVIAKQFLALYQTAIQ